jgi:hypothetical protein
VWNWLTHSAITGFDDWKTHCSYPTKMTRL